MIEIQENHYEPWSNSTIQELTSADRFFLQGEIESMRVQDNNKHFA